MLDNSAEFTFTMLTQTLFKEFEHVNGTLFSTLFLLRTIHDTEVTVVEQWQELFTLPPCSNK